MALPTPTTPVAKSLHTLTVIQQVATLLVGDAGDPEICIDQAMEVLGLYGRPDPYGLRDRALANLQAAVAKAAARAAAA